MRSAPAIAIEQESAESEEKILARAKNAAYRLLTYRPRSLQELRDKLLEREFSEEIVSVVIEHCTRLGYLDDARFAAQMAGSRVRTRNYGRRRIEQELRQKGIDRVTIRVALDESVPREDEQEAARKAAEKKLRTMKLVDSQVRRRRLAGFLERRGFPVDIIRGVLSTVK